MGGGILIRTHRIRAEIVDCWDIARKSEGDAKTPRFAFPKLTNLNCRIVHGEQSPGKPGTLHSQLSIRLSRQALRITERDSK